MGHCCCGRQAKAWARFASGCIGWLVAGAIVCASVIGCGKPGGGFKVVPVSGTVTKDGKGLQGINVVFSPSAQKGTEAGPGSGGVTDAAGKFTLSTMEKNPRKGAVPGKHFVRLSVAQQRAPDDDSVVPAKDAIQIPQKYSDGSLSFEVPASGTDKADFDLSR